MEVEGGNNDNLHEEENRKGWNWFLGPNKLQPVVKKKREKH